MGEFTVCNVCDNPGTFKQAKDVRQISSNVRKFKEHKFTVWRCSSCHSLHSKDSVDLDYYYADYPINNLRFNNFISRLAYQGPLKLLLKHGFKKNHKLLDFGCNQGLFLSFLHQLGYNNAFGYDSYIPKYSDQSVLDHEYDIIFTDQVIEHLKEPRKVFGQLVSCLKKGGLLVVGTPNADEIELSDSYLTMLHQPYHQHILSEKALLNLGLSNGLEVVKVYKRWSGNSLFPTLNPRFIFTYVRCTGNMIDVATEPPRLGTILTSPLLMFYAFAGYFFPHPGNMIVVFRCN
ncbi:class I SAM-dependent methyltransferase [Moorena sp. SIO3H5]|uniref:class I SAM-dependent methyltransferase n=1 Tax=Moorena sp. SIO3H5 TaxID=2607834 RepID=UPI0013BBA396|nr:class I SAM-dependent methyltransferase [Moorena sp. SIO3H5]NEO74379.1 class I SAM-dependent methyltransferase [Moorena sp. SIO3H5]